MTRKCKQSQDNLAPQEVRLLASGIIQENGRMADTLESRGRLRMNETPGSERRIRTDAPPDLLDCVF